MVDEVTDLPATEQADSLDSIISGAIDKAEAPPDPAQDINEPVSDDRPRDERGRFVPKDTASETPDKPAPIEPAKAKTTVAVQPAPQAQQLDPHPRWNEATKAKFSALPGEAKEFALSLQRESEAAFTRKSQELSEFRRTADHWMAAVNPFAEYLSQLAPQLGVTPPEVIRQILAAEYTLRVGTPQQKYQQFAQLAQSYGVDLAALNRGEIAQPDPLIAQLRQQVSDLSQWRQQYETKTAQEQQQALSLHIDAFSKAKDEHGKPRYPHFERVRAPMAQFLSTGEASTLEEAYSKAIAPINEAVAQELASRQQASQKEQQAAIEKARKAAPVRSSGSQPGKTSGGGLDSLLDAAIERAGIR